MTDDFESYALGATVPFGNWTDSGFVFAHNIIAGAAGPTGTKCLNVFGLVVWNDGFYHSNFTQTFWFQAPRSGNLVQLFNGSVALFTLTLEFDCTLTVQGLGNSGIPLKLRQWHSCQLNLSFHQAAGLCTIDVEVAIDGVEQIDLGGTLATGVVEATLSNATSSVNRFGFQGNTTPGCLFDEFNLTTAQAIPFIPVPGTPKVRVTQAVIEMIELPLGPKVRVSQAVMEVAELPASAKVRISQAVIELVMLPTPGGWQVSES